DSIANNYSPAARDFSTYYVYKLNSLNECTEQNRVENVTGFRFPKNVNPELRTVKKKVHKQ
ncbi:hypothetical protein XELAEV_180174174mg, partial [Xenopus laevis]